MLANRLAKLKRRGVGPTNNFVPPTQTNAPGLGPMTANPISMNAPQLGPMTTGMSAMAPRMGPMMNNPVATQFPNPIDQLKNPGIQMDTMPRRRLAAPSFNFGM